MSFPGVAVVIGSASGIGRATAIRYASRGCTRIVLGDSHPVALAETKSLIQNVSRDADVMSLSCDVSSEASVDSFVGQAAATFGRIDYACNVAAVLMPSSSLQPSVAHFDKLFAATTRSTQICQQAQLNQMARQEPFRADDDLYPQRGSIVNILSVCGLRGSDDLHQYCAAKHLITDLTQSDALKVAKYYIRINAIYPGVIRTASLGEPDDDHESVMDDLVSKIAVGRMGLPEEVAEAALFLTSGKASLITAATLAVDGGMQELRSK